MRKLILLFGLLCCSIGAGTDTAKGQAIKTNIPLILIGTPNLGVEWNLSSRLSINADGLWMPYMFKKTEEVFRSMIVSADFRYYLKPKYYYTNKTFDGFYLGPYVMYGDFNVGIDRGGINTNGTRNQGWAVSAGVSLGYKFFLSKRFRLDLNLGVGYAHLQYDKFNLGGEWADYPLERKKTKWWVGPTKFGVHLVYNIFK